MFHTNTQHMIDYWRGKGGLGGAPVRAAIDPTEFPRLAPQALAGRPGVDLGTDARQGDRRADRLVDEIGGTQLEAALLRILVMQRGDEDHRDRPRRLVGLEAAQHLVKRSYSEPRWSRARASAIADERVTL